MSPRPDPDKQQHAVRVATPSTHGQRIKRQWATSTILALLGMAALYHFIQIFLFTPASTSSEDRYIAENIFDWAALQPSRELKWKNCYHGKFDCARLEGPGGSGVAWIADGIGDYLQTIVGNNHDIVSWDPRGVGASIPRVDCWGSSQKRHDWSMQMSGVVDSHPGMLFDALAQFDALSRQCETHMNRMTPELLSHISTASHARDMLEISEKMGFSKVKYWGVSYGTILGGTFAALYPDRVEKLVSDGNVDYHDWFASIKLNYLQDADKIMEAFFEFCNKAGPDNCKFYQATSDAIEVRFLELLASLRKSPVLIPAHTNGTQLEMPELVTYSKLQNLIRGCMYKPIYRFPALARVMAALEQRDGVPYYQLRGEDMGGPPQLDFCLLNETLPTVPSIPQHSDDAFPAIMCADSEAADADEWTPDTFLAYFEELQRISRYAGASNMHSQLSCAGRQDRPRWRYAGPFRNITTSFPILFIGNIADNVTPLSSARNNSRAFPGSVVLVQRSYGHASLAAPSTCTAKVIREYFQQGTLPAPETECGQDWELFEDPPPVLEGVESDRDLQVAVRELSRTANVAIGS
ncbi:hypothetical protein TruAng_002562 [Truncatella angustata]|nr:hypothetical protein TruAng_002562 [Truncatella angustata]